MERHLAGRLPGDRDDRQRANPLAHGEFTVDFSTLARGVRGVVPMDQGLRLGARADEVRCARMVTIGEENLRDADAHDFGDISLVRRYRVDAEIAFGVAQQMTVEVIAVWFGKPRPGKDIEDDLLHECASFTCAHVDPRRDAKERDRCDAAPRTWARRTP